MSRQSLPEGDRRIGRREILLGGALLGVAAAAHAMRPRAKIDLLGSSQLDRIVPERVGSWRFLSRSGLVVPPADQLSSALYAQLLTRTYISDDLPSIMLLIAQSPAQDGVLQMHRPEYCYPAGGYALSGRHRQLIQMTTGQTVPATAFTASSPERTEQLLYWTRVGRGLPTTWVEQRLSVAKANVMGYIPDGVLVRASTISNDPAALDMVVRFLRELVGTMAPRSRQVLVGAN